MILQHQNTQVNKELWTESLTYGDMQILPMVDYYNIITYKTLAICMYAVSASLAFLLGSLIIFHFCFE
jgi:beta-1,3-galactosyltransferase